MQVATIGNWLTELNIQTSKPVKLWIDICQIPPKDGTFHIFYACEPSVIAPYIIPWIQQNYQHFDVVLGYEPEVLSCPNSKFFFWSRTWINSQEENSIQNKEYNVSFICGGNVITENHKKRISCWMRQEEIIIPKMFFYTTRNDRVSKIFDANLPCPRDSKLAAFEKSMFHIVVENCCLQHCITEKIFDCFVTMTVPIYLGCPNIGEYFDIRGIIIVSSVNEIIEQCNKLTKNDYYSRMEYMETNKKLSNEKYPFDFNKGFKYHLNPILKTI